MRGIGFLLAAAVCSLAQTPADLLESARAGNTRRIEALLSKRADLEVRDKEGRTPLMLAAQYGRKAAVQLLLDKGAKTDARDSHGWNAYMLALLAPSGGLIHTTPDAVLKLLPQPRRFRLAVNAAWVPSESSYSSCFLRPEELTRHLRQIRPDALVIEAFQRFAVGAGRDLIAIVQSDALGTSEVPNKTPPEDIDATLFLMAETGATCAPRSDQLSLLIHAALTRPASEQPVIANTFGGTSREVAMNPNQYGPLYAAWVKTLMKELYWTTVTALMRQP